MQIYSEKPSCVLRLYRYMHRVSKTVFYLFNVIYFILANYTTFYLILISVFEKSRFGAKIVIKMRFYSHIIKRILRSWSVFVDIIMKLIAEKR